MAVVRSKLQDVTIPEDIKSFPEFILGKFDEYGDKVAIVDSASGRSFTYTQLKALTRKCGSALVKQGFQYKDTLAIILPNIIEYPIVFYGVMSIGGIATTINPTYTVRELVYQLNDSCSNYVITVPSLVEKVTRAAAQCGIRLVLVLGEADGYESFEKLILSDDGSSFPKKIPVPDWKEDVCCLPYSSGTTGLPKGVMLTHYNLICHALIVTHPERMVLPEHIDRRVSLLVIPMFHLYGLSILLGILLYLGSKLVCMRQFEPMAFLKAIQDHKVTHLSLVPPLVLFLTKHPSVKKYDLSSVYGIGCGAAPLGDGVMDALKARMPNVEAITQGYGLTETSPSCMGTSPGKFKPASVGGVLPNLQAKVIDLRTGELLPARKDGEICMKGPTIMKGYFNNPKATAETIDSEGWLHTGDIGHYDEEEHFYIVGRVKELIKYKGFQVPPAELEDLLQSHPQTVDAAVIGIPNTEAGELPKAFVVLREGSHGITAEDIVKFVSENVAPHKRLRGGVEFVKSIPKNASGKIMRRQLREQEALKTREKIKHKL